MSTTTLSHQLTDEDSKEGQSHYLQERNIPTDTSEEQTLEGSHMEGDKDMEANQQMSAVEQDIRKKRQRMAGRNGCLRCLCCACCLPAWATALLWGIVAAIIIVIIVIGALFGSFRMPVMNMVSAVPSSNTSIDSAFSLSNGVLSIPFGLVINVDNPNVLPIDLYDIRATAYDNADGALNTSVAIGYGNLTHQYIPKQSNFNFTFPFEIVYNPMLDPNGVILDDIAEKCGLLGDSSSKLTIDYTIKLTAKVLFVTVHPTLSSTASINCPIKNEK